MANTIIERLTRIEEKLDASLKRVEDHEARIRSGERSQWIHSGILLIAAPYLAKFGIHLPI